MAARGDAGDRRPERRGGTLGTGREAASGSGAVAVIEDPGIGKTTVLDGLAEECDRLGMRVLRALEELERTGPLRGL